VILILRQLVSAPEKPTQVPTVLASTAIQHSRKIKYRHSDRLKERMEETNKQQTILAVLDEGVFRLPEELNAEQ
jgi:hypothetical protein